MIELNCSKPSYEPPPSLTHYEAPEESYSPSGFVDSSAGFYGRPESPRGLFSEPTSSNAAGIGFSNSGFGLNSKRRGAKAVFPLLAPAVSGMSDTMQNLLSKGSTMLRLKERRCSEDSFYL